MSQHTNDDLLALLGAYSENVATTFEAAAVHLLVFTELPYHPRFIDHLHIEAVLVEGEPVPMAFIKDWHTLAEAVPGRAGSMTHRLLALAAALATGAPLNLRENLTGFGHATAQRVAEATLIASGYGDWYALQPTAVFDEHVARRDEMLGGDAAAGKL